MREIEKIDELKRDVKNWFSFFNDNIQRFKSNYEFCFVDQWDAVDKMSRINRSTLTVNKISASLRSIIGQFEKNPPDIMVLAKGQKSNQEVIDIYSGLTRYISTKSDAEVVYSQVFKDILVGGFGAFLVDYVVDEENPFFNSLRIKRVEFNKCFFDPKAKLATKNDGDFCGYIVKIGYDTLFEKFGLRRGEVVPFSETARYEDIFYDNDSITIVNLFKKVPYQKKVFLLGTGEVVDEKELKKLEEEFIIKNDFYAVNSTFDSGQNLTRPVPPTVIDEKTVTDHKIIHYVFAGNKIIDEKVFPGKSLPMVFVDGFSSYSDGFQRTSGFFEQSTDPQRIYNYAISELSDALLSNTTRSWLATVDMIDGFENIWKNAKYQEVLLYNPSPNGDKPIVVNPPPVSQEIFQIFAQTMGDIYSSIGNYEESRGEASNAISGAAIINRQLASNTNIYPYISSIRNSLKKVWEVITDLIPVIYDAERIITIIDEKGQYKNVKVNELRGFEIHNDLTKNKFSVHVSVGGSLEAQKQLALKMGIELLGLLPPDKRPIFVDLIAKNIELQNMPEIVARLREFVVPPQVIAAEEGKTYTPPPNPEQILIEKEIQLKESQLKQMEIENITNLMKIILEKQENQADNISRLADSIAKIINAEGNLTKEQNETAKMIVNEFDKIIKEDQENIDKIKEKTR